MLLLLCTPPPAPQVLSWVTGRIAGAGVQGLDTNTFTSFLQSCGIPNVRLGSDLIFDNGRTPVPPTNRPPCRARRERAAWPSLMPRRKLRPVPRLSPTPQAKTGC